MKWRMKKTSKWLLLLIPLIYGIATTLLRVANAEIKWYIISAITYIILWAIAQHINSGENREIEEKINRIDAITRENNYSSSLVEAQQGLAGIISNPDCQEACGSAASFV